MAWITFEWPRLNVILDTALVMNISCFKQYLRPVVVSHIERFTS